MGLLKDESVGRKALRELRAKPGYRSISKERSDNFNRKVAEAMQEIQNDFIMKEKNSRTVII